MPGKPRVTTPTPGTLRKGDQHWKVSVFYRTKNVINTRLRQILFRWEGRSGRYVTIMQELDQSEEGLRRRRTRTLADTPGPTFRCKTLRVRKGGPDNGLPTQIDCKGFTRSSEITEYTAKSTGPLGAFNSTPAELQFVESQLILLFESFKPPHAFRPARWVTHRQPLRYSGMQMNVESFRPRHILHNTSRPRQILHSSSMPIEVRSQSSAYCLKCTTQVYGYTFQYLTTILPIMSASIPLKSCHHIRDPHTFHSTCRPFSDVYIHRMPPEF